MIRILLLTFIISTTYAERLVPVPFNKQLSESDGVLMGQFIGQSYRRMRDGKVDLGYKPVTLTKYEPKERVY